MGPHRLTPRVQTQSSRDTPPTAAPPAPTPALLITRVGAAPNQDCDRSAKVQTSSNRDTSQRIAVAFAPRSVIASAVLGAADSSMSLQTPAPPRRASSTANAAPIPLPAPVTTADAPWLVVLDLLSSLSSEPNISQPASA